MLVQVRSQLMQELPCPLSLRRTIVLVTLSHFCGSNAACLATAPNLSRYKSFLDDIFVGQAFGLLFFLWFSRCFQNSQSFLFSAREALHNLFEQFWGTFPTWCVLLYRCVSWCVPTMALLCLGHIIRLWQRVQEKTWYRVLYLVHVPHSGLLSVHSVRSALLLSFSLHSVVVLVFDIHDIQILFFCNPGLLTIGPRFGGAIDDAARYFKDAHDRGLSPYEFVETMKKKGIRVPGIGHRYKTISTSDHLNSHSSSTIK